jgi:vitamin B12 transporter
VRRFLACFLLSSLSAATASAQVTGMVLDPDARPIPRVLVTATDAGGKELARVFTATDGSFRLDVNPATGCLLEARLTGFNPARTDCGRGTDLRIALAVRAVDEMIVVSATRTETPISQVASSLTMFSSEDMDRRQRPMLTDLLRSAPGTAVVGGVPGAVASLFVRGGESNYTKVLLDGIPLNEPGGPFDFSNVSTAHLGRVELVRGAHSSLFGSDAVAGVLHLFTRRARRGEPNFDGTIEGGNNGTFRGAVTYSNASTTWDYSLHVTRFDTDNEAPNNEFGGTTLSASAGVTPGRGIALRFVTRGVFSTAGTPGQVAFGRPDLDAFFDRNDFAAGSRFTQQLAPSLHHSAIYSYTASNQIAQNTKLDPPYTPRFGDRAAPFQFRDFPYHSNNDLGRHHLGYQADWRMTPANANAGTHVSTFAVDWDGERATLRNILAAATTRVERNNFGASLQHQILWPRVFATVGVRLENNDSFGFAAVPRGSLTWVARDTDGAVGTTRVKIAAGGGIKEPTMLQSFSPSPVFPGNPDLDPERSRTLDAGVEQTLFHKMLIVEATWFANRFRDIISTRVTSFSPFTLAFLNVGESRARGLELSAHLAPHSGFRLRGGYTLLASEVISSAADFDPVYAPGQWLVRRPRHSGFLEMGGAWRELDLSLFGIFVGKAVDSDFSSLDPPITFNERHARWDVRASYRLSKRLRATVAVDNLLNRAYMEPLGYPALGRTARAGVHVAF